MAQPNRKQQRKTVVKSNADTAPESARVRPAGPLKQYLIINVGFWAFCIIQLMFIRMLLRDFAGLYFFFGFLAVAFSIVTIFDFVASRMARDTEADFTDVPSQN